MKREAVFSPCGQFRYLLKRVWDESKPILPWGLCNPSVAGAEKDDPTARKVVGFSERLGYGGAVIWNPFAFISTDPKGLKAAGWPIGPENDRYIIEACRMGDGKVICGWGANLRGLERPRRVLDMLWDNGFVPMALKVTGDGLPMHPLYLPYEARPFSLAEA
jgi:hypothetical protein